MPFETLEIFGWLIDGLAGWRYLFSASFRQRTHKRWKAEGWERAVIEIFFGGLAVFLTLLLAWALIGVIRE